MLRIWQHGVRYVVALMGSTCSPEQGKLIVKVVAPSYANAAGSGGRVWVLSDGDEAGERCAQSVFSEVAAARCVRWARVDAGKQPTDYPPERILAELMGI
jgi:DNA primase